MSKVSDFTMSGLVFGLLLFSSVSLMIFGFSGDMFNTYNSSVQTSKITTQAQKVDTKIGGHINQTTQEAEEISGSISAGLFFIKSVGNIVDLTISAVPIAENLVVGLAFGLPVPDELVSLITGFIAIGVIYAAVRLYRGGTG